jgi:hypothetical protein
MAMIRNPKCTKRTKILAMRVLTALEAQNMEQERRDLKIPEYVEERVTIAAEELTDDYLARLLVESSGGRPGIAPPS